MRKFIFAAEDKGHETVTKIYRLPAVMQVTGLSKASVYVGMKNGTFPASVKLGPRTVGWSAEAVEAWIKSRLNQSASA